MLFSLKPFDLWLWVVIAVCQLLLSLVVFRAHLHVRYPRFATLVHFSAGESLVLMTLPGWLYGWLYFVCSYMGLFLMGLAIGEMYGRVFGPRISLPTWAPRMIAACLAGGFCLSAALAILFRPVNGSANWTILGSVQNGMATGLFFSAMVLLVYAKWLDTEWRPWPARITAGFVLLLAFNTCTAYLLGQLQDNVDTVRRIGQIAHLSAWIWWTAALWEKEPRLTITPEIEALARQALDHSAANCEAAQRIFPAQVSGGD